MCEESNLLGQQAHGLCIFLPLKLTGTCPLKLVRESLNVLLEGVPPGIDVKAVELKIMERKGVKSVHDLHVWCITPAKICAMSCHVLVEKDTDRKKLTSDLILMLRDEFGIDHTTIQIEDEEYPKAISEH